MPSLPVVGIVGHGYLVPKFFGDLAVTGTPRTYVDRVAAAGARPVILPGNQAMGLLDVVDALVLTGGGDVDPALHGGSPDSGIDVDRTRDEDEIALVHAAARAGVPLLGVCRGLQVPVVAYGGTLTGDLGMSHVLPEVGHPVTTQPGSLTHCALGGRPHVSSLHHQSVADPGPCWRATAWADDGVVEAAEWVGPEPWPVLAVQWHPELDGKSGSALFAWLVDAAIASSTRKQLVEIGELS
jgi:putative glutamine amidotransferase